MRAAKPAIRGIVAAGVLVAVVSLCFWYSSSPSVQHLQVAGTSGRSVRIAGYAAVERDCRAAPMPRADVVDAPRHGTVVFRETENMPPGLDPQASQLCAGRRLTGKIVLYNPHVGFSGSDAFVYRITPALGGGSREVSAEVDVR